MPTVKARVGKGESFSFYPVDERKVPFEDVDCNWRICWEELLQPAGLGQQRSHHFTEAKPFRAALEVEFGGNSPVFDQVYLGMGEDGHTASLFPGKESLKDRQSWTLDVVGPKPPPARVTLGFRPIWDCKSLIAIALGAGKVEMVNRIRSGDMSLPITQALAGHGKAVLLLDKAAAGE
jgi:6-phosphogluconolactonase